MKFKRELGQNFLKDPDVIEMLVTAGGISEKDTVLEIGSGAGAVTSLLAKKAGFVLTLEFDSTLIPTLNSNLKDFKNVTVLNTDALKFLETGSSEIRTLGTAALKTVTLEMGTKEIPAVNKVVASIPYQITSPLLHKLLPLKDQIKTIVLLVQKEVAQRIASVPPKSNYLATLLATFFKIEIISFVKKEAFIPVPKVDGAIIKLTTLNDSKVKPDVIQLKDIPKFEKFLHHGFSQQRKMLNKKFDIKLLDSLNISPTRRPETLTINEWVKLFNVTSQLFQQS